MKTLFFIFLFGLTNHSCICDGEEPPSNPSTEQYQNIDSSSPEAVVYTLDNSGVFHRSRPEHRTSPGTVVYSVLQNGILIPKPGQYHVRYKITKRGDLIPLPSNDCIYKSEKPAFYLKTKDEKLIPVDIFYSGNEIHYVFAGNHLLLTEKVTKSIKNSKFFDYLDSAVTSKLQAPVNLIPDKSCNGDIILFLLKSNGVFSRNPADQYIPKGMKLRYHLQNDGSLTPLSTKSGVPFTYITEINGNLLPAPSNTHTLTTLKETSKSFILGEGGVLAPVSEILGINKTVNYFFDGRLVHSSKQFKKAYSNSSMVVVSEKSNSEDTQIQANTPGPKFQCASRRISKRDTHGKYESVESGEELEDLPIKGIPAPACGCAYDEYGKRILLEPLVNSCGQIALYKLTCKGHMKRLAPYKEPEHGFEVRFKFLDNCVMIPVSKDNGKIYLRYTLMENGNLVPVPRQCNTLKKAPASMVYFVLAKNKELLPVRLNILKSNHIQVYFQDCLIYTIPPEFGKKLEVFTTIYAPFYVYINSRIVVGYIDPIPKKLSGSTWTNPLKYGDEPEFPCQNLFLIGPNGQKIKIVPHINKNGVPVIYEMDCNGVCHKSPKDDNKNMVLRSFKLLKEGIMMPTNETNGYIYLIDKLGNMLPYCFPESKLRAPFGLTVKYVLCEDYILLPVLVQALDNFIQFSFEGTIVYKKRTYTIEQILEIEAEKKCIKPPEIAHVEEENISYFKDKDGNCAYYEKCGNFLKRYPPQKIGEHLIHSMGYFKILPNGILQQADFPDSKCDNLHVMIEKNGDLQILPNNKKKLDHTDYLMNTKGDLIPVEVKKREHYIKFYRNGERVFKQMLNFWKVEDEDVKTPSGQDTLGLLKDKEPEKMLSDEPHHVTIPIKAAEVPPSSRGCDAEREKCEHIRKLILGIMEKNRAANQVELVMPDALVKEIYDLAHKCSKVKNHSRSTRSVEEIDYSNHFDCKR